jgi:hypothetical protein
LWAVIEVTDRVAGEKIAPEDLLDEISIPSGPESAEEREDYDGWSAGAVRAGIGAVPRQRRSLTTLLQEEVRRQKEPGSLFPSS